MRQPTVAVEIDPVEPLQRGGFRLGQRDALVAVGIGGTKHRPTGPAAQRQALAPLAATSPIGSALAAQRFGAGPFVAADHDVAIGVEPAEQLGPARRIGRADTATLLQSAANLPAQSLAFGLGDEPVAIRVDTAEQGASTLDHLGAGLDSIARSGGRIRRDLRTHGRCGHKQACAKNNLLHIASICPVSLDARRTADG